MLPNDRQRMVVIDGLQADMDMVVVQETIIRRTTLDFVEKFGSGVAHVKLHKANRFCYWHDYRLEDDDLADIPRMIVSWNSCAHVDHRISQSSDRGPLMEHTASSARSSVHRNNSCWTIDTSCTWTFPLRVP